MPSYKYNPDLINNRGLFITTFNVYDPVTKTSKVRKINRGEIFATDSYLSNNIMKKEEFEFVSDEPIISPIIYNYNGSDENALEISECDGLVDIYVSVLNNENNNAYIELFFNNDKNNVMSITPYSSGTIFRCISNSKIRIINTIPYNDAKYTISLLDAEQFATNNSVNIF